ncbi:MAG: hypothetical protein HFF52_03920, partial [Lawsonibacter sp.]|nr:hypothetical protein [Lawsonibacter sp.]
GYVNLATSLGIISGYGNGQFGPGDPVTTAQAALMLTKALGYYQNNEITGDWSQDALAAITQATRLTMFEGIKAPAANEGLTRDNVAVMSFNTLTRATPVRFNSIVNEYYTVGGSLTTGVEYIDAYEYGQTGTEYDHTLGYTIYGLYISNSGDNDDFGRPAEEWSYEKGGVIGSFNKEPIATYTAKASNGDLFNLIGSSNVNKLGAGANGKNKLEVYVDGETAGVSQDPDSYFVRNSSNGNESGKGVLTEVYQDEDNNVTLVYINTYVMQATDDYSSSKGSIDVTVLTGDATVNALNDDDFAQITGYAEDDYILYTYANDEVQSVAKAEVLAGEVTAYSNATGKTFGDASGSVSIEGEKHDYAKYAEVDSDNGCAVTYTVGVNASIVLDKYGYAIYVDDASMSVGNYVYIAAIANETNLSTKVVAEAYFTDGRDETITAKSITAADGTTDLSEGLRDEDRLATDAVKGWYSYSRNSKNEYTLKKAENTGKLTGTSIDQNKVSIAGTVTGNSSTLFVVKDKNNNINLYTGIANVPDITGITRDNSWYLCDGDTAGKPASVVFVDATSGSVKNSTSSFLFLLKKDSTSVDKSDNEEVYTWTVLLDGKKETIQTKQDWTKNTLYENYSIDADGFYEADSTDKFIEATANDDKFAEELTNKLIKNSSDALTIGGKTFVTNSDTKINVIMAPTTKGAGDLLSGTIMTDDNADYELMLGATGRALANKFDSDKYCVTGKYYVVYDDEGGSDLITDLYVVITAADIAENAAPDTPPVTEIEDTSSASNINDALNGEGTDFTMNNPTVVDGVAVPAEKTLTISGTIGADGAITGEGAVVIDEATVGADVDLTGAADATLGTVEVTADKTVSVDDVTLTGEITLKAGATLDVTGTVTVDGAAIIAEAGAKIVVQDGADVSALAGIDGLKFYNADGSEFVLPTARTTMEVAAIPAGTYAYDETLSGWKRTELYEAGEKTKISSVTLAGVTAPATGVALGEPTCSTNTVDMTYSWGNGNTKDTPAVAETVYTLIVTLTVKNAETHEFDTEVACTLAGKTGTWDAEAGTLTFVFDATGAAGDTFDETKVTIDSTKTLEAGAVSGNTVTATIDNGYATIGTTVASSDETVATAVATEAGVITITAKKAGTANLTVTATKVGGTATKDYTIAVTVEAVDFSGNSLSAESGNINNTSGSATGTFTVTVANGFEIKSVTSGDETVATVSESSGTVTITAVKDGEVTITVTIAKTGTNPEQTTELEYTATVQNTTSGG